MIKKIVTLRCLTSPPPRRRSRVLLSPPPSATPTTTSATAFVTCGFLRFSISDCADELPCDMFEEGGRVWLCALRVCVCVAVASCFVCLFCEVVVYFFTVVQCGTCTNITCGSKILFEFKARYLNSKI